MADLVEMGKECEKRGNLQQALIYYTMAVEENLGSFDIRCHQGRVFNRLRQYDDAKVCFDRVLSMDENHFESTYESGISSLGLNKWKDALKYFYKCKGLNLKNANVWYYLAVIFKEKGLEDEYKIAYENFLKLDNNDKEFGKKRLQHEFGIVFRETEIELINEFGEDFEKTDTYFNINACINFFYKIGLTDKEISYYLNSVPIDDLQKIIDESCANYNDQLEINIIKNDLMKDFDEEKVDFYIDNLPLENLKDLIISGSETNPFNKIERISAPDIYDKFRNMPLNYAYELKIPNMNIHIDNEMINGNDDKLFLTSYDKNKEMLLVEKDFNQLSEKIFLNKDEGIKSLFDKIESFNISQFNDLRIKLNYFKVLINYYCNHEIQYEETYNPLDKISQLVPDIASNPIYIYIKSTILYDTQRYEEAIINLNSIDLSQGTELNHDYVYYLLSSAYYKLGDFVNSYNEYNKISSKKLNKDVLKNLSEIIKN